MPYMDPMDPMRYLMPHYRLYTMIFPTKSPDTVSYPIWLWSPFAPIPSQGTCKAKVPWKKVKEALVAFLKNCVERKKKREL